MQLRKVNIKPGPKRPPVVTSGKNIRRTAKQRQRVNADSSMGLYKTSPSYPMTPGSTSNPVKGYSKSGFRGQTFNIPKGVKISREGMAFLKCAFAPPDFGESLATGVPDSFEGTSLVKKHRYVVSQSIPAATDRYILLLPVPGIAYYQLDMPAGSAPVSNSVFTGYKYTDFDSMFGTPDGTQTADIVNKFRFVSNHIELVPTVNAVSWTGSIQCWKLPIQLAMKAIIGAASYTITGGQGVNATNPNQYTGPFNNGVYCGAYSSGQSFSFNSIIEDLVAVPSVSSSSDFLRLDYGASGLNPDIACTPGFDNDFESVIIKISGAGNNAANSYILKTWACVEYQVVPGSPLYEYQSLGCRDDAAMQVYKRVIRELPVAKTYMDNDTFWQHVLNIIRMISGGLSYIPGPYGQIAGGVNAAAAGLQLLT